MIKFGTNTQCNIASQKIKQYIWKGLSKIDQYFGFYLAKFTTEYSNNCRFFLLKRNWQNYCYETTLLKIDGHKLGNTSIDSYIDKAKINDL